MEKNIPKNNLKLCHILALAFLSIVIAMVRTNVVDWAYLFADQPYNPNLKLHNYSQLYSLFLLLGVLVAGWCSDNLFCGKRWKTIILFNLGIVVLLLFFWLIPQNIIIQRYGCLLVVMSFLVNGLRILILITAFELSHEKIRGIVTAALFALSLISPAISHFLLSFLGKYIGKVVFSSIFWPSLCFAIVLSTLGIWYCFSSKNR